MSSYCRCGGYIGNGGVEGFAGKWCKCINPIRSNIGIFVSDEIKLDSKHIDLKQRILQFRDEIVESNPEFEATFKKYFWDILA